MRKLLLICVMLSALAVKAQVWTPGGTVQLQQGSGYNNLRSNFGVKGNFTFYTKAQVDSIFAGFTPNLSFSNGLNKIGSVVSFGGALNQNTTVDNLHNSLVFGNPQYSSFGLNDAYLSFTSQDFSTDASQFVITPTYTQLNVGTNGVSSTSITAYNNSLLLTRANLQGYDPTESLNIGGGTRNNPSNDYIVVTDEIHNLGVINDGDYEANFLPRSLITKQYLTQQLSGIDLRYEPLLGYSASNTSIPFTRSIIAYGSSLTFGLGTGDITTENQTWLFKTSTTMGYIPINHGVGGRATEQLTAGDNSLYTVRSTIQPPNTPNDILLVDGMVNDIVKSGYDTATYRTHLMAVGASIIASWSPGQVILHNPSYYSTTYYGQTNIDARHTQYSAITSQVAAYYGFLFFDGYAAMKAANSPTNQLVGADSLHMLQLGTTFYANELNSFITSHFGAGVNYSNTSSATVGNIIANGNASVNGNMTVQGSLLLPSLYVNGTTNGYGNNGILKIAPNGIVSSGQVQLTDLSSGFTSAYSTTSSLASTFIPYTGATGNVNLGSNSLSTTGLTLSNNSAITMYNGGTTSTRTGIGSIASGENLVLYGYGGGGGQMLLGLGLDPSNMTSLNAAIAINNSNQATFNQNATFNNYILPASGVGISFYSTSMLIGRQSGTTNMVVEVPASGTSNIMFGTGQSISSATTSNVAGYVSTANNFVFNGTPTAPTATPGTNTTQIATTSFATNHPSLIGASGTIANTMYYNTATASTPTTDSILVKESGKLFATRSSYKLSSDSTLSTGFATNNALTNYATRPIGLLYTWPNRTSSLTDFTYAGFTPTLSGGNIVFTGGSNTYTQTMIINGFTNNDPNIDVDVPFQIGTIGHGIGIGRKSVDVESSCVVQYDETTNSLIFTSLSGNVVLATIPSNFTVSNGDYCILRYSQKQNIVTGTFTDVSHTGASFSASVPLGTAGYTSPTPNTSDVCIYNIGGTNTITGISFKSRSLFKPNIIHTGDSKVTGVGVPDPKFRWANEMSQLGSNEVYAGGGDKIADGLAAQPYILNYVKPQSVTVEYLRNDLPGSGGALSTAAKTAYQTYISNFQAAGIPVYIILPTPELVYTDQSSITTFLSTTYPTLTIDPASGAVTFNTSTMLAVDGIHQNPLGMTANSANILYANKIPLSNTVNPFIPLDPIIPAVGTTYTTGYIPFGQGSTTLTQSGALNWNSSTNRLGIGVTLANADQAITVSGNIHQVGTNGKILMSSAIGTDLAGFYTSNSAGNFASDSQVGDLIISNLNSSNTIRLGAGTGAKSTEYITSSIVGFNKPFILNASTSGGITYTVPATVTPYTLTDPGAAPPISGSVKAFTTSGTGSWISTPTINSTADLTAQTAAGNITTFTVGASTATFDVSGYINVTAIATDVIAAQITYTDENGTAQTITLSNISAIGNNSFSSGKIRCKNGTLITAKTTLTTGIGSITFDAGARIVAY